MLLAVAWSGNFAEGQAPPWLLFPDDPAVSATECGVVNAGNIELIVRADSLALETPDGIAVPSTSVQTITPVSLVDVEGTDAFILADVFFDNLPFGFLAFSEDSDGVRSVWWLQDVGTLFRVVDVVGNPPEPQVTTRSPRDIVGAFCDACEVLIDAEFCGCSSSVECDDLNECTDDVCLVTGECASFDNSGACDDGDPCTEDDTCAGGDCAGIPVDDCDDNSDGVSLPPTININICGAGSTAAMMFMLVVIPMLSVARRRV